MMTVEDLLRGAFAALLRGDLEERDRLVGLAQNLMNARERVKASGDAKQIVVGEPIKFRGAQ